MKALIVYYSQSGNVKWASEALGKELDATLLPLIPKKEYPNKGFRKFFVGGGAALLKKKPALKPYEANLSEYDLIVLADPVWNARVAPPILTFLKENDLKGKKVALMLSSGSGNAEKAFKELKKILKENPIAELSLKNPLQSQEESKKQIAEFAVKLK